MGGVYTCINGFIFDLKTTIPTCRKTSVSDDISSNTDIESIVCSHLKGNLIEKGIQPVEVLTPSDKQG